MTEHLDTTQSGQLPDRGVIRVSGSDALSFLDKLVTSDLDGLAPGDSRMAALLSPQGKVLFEFIVVRPRESDALLIDVARVAAPDLVKRLWLYKLRAKVDIADASADIGVAVGLSGVTSYRDPRHEGLPRRAFVAAVGGAIAGTDHYHGLRIGLRVPEGGLDYALGTVVAHEALLDALNGVSFTKGCYVGQEIVARMEHRGTARKRFVRVSGGSALPPMGTEIRAGEALLGQMGSSSAVAGAARGLALLRLDRLAEFANAGVPLMAGGIEVAADPGDVAALMPRAPDPVDLS